MPASPAPPTRGAEPSSRPRMDCATVLNCDEGVRDSLQPRLTSAACREKAAAADGRAGVESAVGEPTAAASAARLEGGVGCAGDSGSSRGVPPSEEARSRLSCSCSCMVAFSKCFFCVFSTSSSSLRRLSSSAVSVWPCSSSSSRAASLAARTPSCCESSSSSFRRFSPSSARASRSTSDAASACSSASRLRSSPSRVVSELNKPFDTLAASLAAAESAFALASAVES
mmetsp:Transcript_36352/g.77524  ORF Transcript_36352/g.77524 Transcript_36352/m.77524 type:complete len:228 (+) Transcript_36352:260-943(+)